MNAVVASILPLVGDRDHRFYHDDEPELRRRDRGRPRPRDDPSLRPSDRNKLSSLAELYTKLTLDEEIPRTGPVITPRLLSDVSPSARLSRTEYKRTVEVRISFLKILRIDTRKQKYDADVFIQAKWGEPLLDGRTARDLEDFAIDSYWNPGIYIPNLSGAPDREETWCEVQPGGNHPVVVWKKRIKGQFNERLELEDFPFDVQELQLKVASRLTEHDLNLVEDRVRLSTVSRNNLVDHSEWKLYDHVDAVRCIVRNKLPTAKHHHPCISFMCSVRRIPTFYFFNIFFMMFLLCSLVFTTLGIPAQDYEERLKVNIVLLLSVVAMKYVATNFYPVDLAYLTYMDIYNLLCVIVVTLMAVQNAILSIWRNDAGTLATVDISTIYVVLAIFLLIQISAILTAIIVICKGRYGLSRRDKEYHEEQRRRRAVDLGKPVENGRAKKSKKQPSDEPMVGDEFGMEDIPSRTPRRGERRE